MSDFFRILNIATHALLQLVEVLFHGCDGAEELFLGQYRFGKFVAYVMDELPQFPHIVYMDFIGLIKRLV